MQRLAMFCRKRHFWCVTISKVLGFVTFSRFWFVTYFKVFGFVTYFKVFGFATFFKVCLLASFSVPHLSLPVVGFWSESHFFVSSYHCWKFHKGNQPLWTIRNKTWSQTLHYIHSCAKTVSPKENYRLYTLPYTLPLAQTSMVSKHHNIKFSKSDCSPMPA